MMPRRLAALIDQGAISATNFLLFLYCARVMETGDWGAFGFGYAAVLFAQGFQRAIVTIPMITLSPSMTEWTASAPFWARLNAQLTLVFMALSGIVVWATTLTGIEWLVFSSLCIAALTGPLMLMEFCRRASIQSERYNHLVLIATAYSLGIALVAVLWRPQWNDKWLPLVALCIGGVLATFVFKWTGGVALLGSKIGARTIDGHHSFSGWAVMSHLGFSGYNFGIQAMLGALSGPAALGTFHACRALLQPVNTLIGAMDSIDKPRAARSYAVLGRSGLFTTLRSALFILVALAGTYIAFVYVFDTHLLTLAYANKYSDQELVVLGWCAVSTLAIFMQPIESGLYVIKRTKAMFLSRLIATAMSVSIGCWLIGQYGAIGALIAMTAGYATSAILGTFLLHRYS